MDIKEVLQTIHEEIMEYRRHLLHMKNKIEDMQEIIKNIEVEQAADIASAVDENGKPLFSNELKRQAELERRKKENTEYQKLVADLKTRKLEYDMSVIILQGMLDKQENARALARMEEK